METPIQEKGPEKILTREEVMGVISKYAENPEFENEVMDELGLFLLEVKVPGKEAGEMTHYVYRRRRPGLEDNKTSINRVFHENEIPVGGNEVAAYNYMTGEWEE